MLVPRQSHRSRGVTQGFEPTVRGVQRESFSSLRCSRIARHRKSGVWGRPASPGAISCPCRWEPPPTADNIVAFQCKARGINFDVTGCTTLKLFVFIKLVANRRRASDIRFDGRHIGRRGRNMYSHDPFEHPNASGNRRRRGSVRSHLQDTRMCDDAPASTLRPDIDTFQPRASGLAIL